MRGRKVMCVLSVPTGVVHVRMGRAYGDGWCMCEQGREDLATCNGSMAIAAWAHANKCAHTWVGGSVRPPIRPCVHVRGRHACASAYSGSRHGSSEKLSKAVEVVGGCPKLCKAVRSCGRLSEIVEGCPKLWKAVRSCGRLSEVVGGCPKLSKAVRSCERLSEGFRFCHRLSKAFIDRRKLAKAV